MREEDSCESEVESESEDQIKEEKLNMNQRVRRVKKKMTMK